MVTGFGSRGPTTNRTGLHRAIVAQAPTRIAHLILGGVDDPWPGGGYLVVEYQYLDAIHPPLTVSWQGPWRQLSVSFP